MDDTYGDYGVFESEVGIRMEIDLLSGADRRDVDGYIKEEWGGPMIVSLGNLYDSSVLPGFIASENGQMTGAVLYRVEGSACEIAVLYSLMENHGVGTALIRRVMETAREHGCHRVWLVTTNDNTHAIRFYQKFGFDLKAVHINSLEVTRQLKGGLPEKGIDGIPLKHEFEFEILI